jgi:CO/xanthine dehydrogenase FAD-binding subunit
VRAFLPAYHMETPRDLAAALDRMAKEPGIWKPFAGGTDLMVLLEAGKLPHKKFLNIWSLQELRGIAANTEHTELGALTTYTEVRRHEILAREFPLLCRAAAETGSIATQNRGTLGGNIANASPAADSPPALLVYDAEIEIVSASGARWIPYQSFHSGYKQMDLRPDELIRRIRLPRNKNAWKQYFRKVGPRRAQAISKICFAAAARVEAGKIADVRIVLGSVAPTVLRATRAEEALRGRRPDPELLKSAQDALANEIAPIDDIRSTSRYRRAVARNLLAEFIESLAG